AAQNRVAVQTAGVDVFRLHAVAFAVGGGLAGVSGGRPGPRVMVFPPNRAVWRGKGFAGFFHCGVGVLPGEASGGGRPRSWAAFVSSPYQNVYGFLLVILVLIVRPEGLFGERGREA